MTRYFKHAGMVYRILDNGCIQFNPWWVEAERMPPRLDKLETSWMNSKHTDARHFMTISVEIEPNPDYLQLSEGF